MFVYINIDLPIDERKLASDYSTHKGLKCGLLYLSMDS